MPELPKTYVNFRETFPQLAEAYDRLGAAAHEAGPMAAKERELVKLGIAIGARQEGAVHSHTRRALENGATKEEVLQVVALAVTSIGFGPSVAAFSWVTDEFGGGVVALGRSGVVPSRQRHWDEGSSKRPRGWGIPRNCGLDRVAGTRGDLEVTGGESTLLVT